MVDSGGSLGNSAKLVLIKLLTCVYFNTPGEKPYKIFKDL